MSPIVEIATKSRDFFMDVKQAVTFGVIDKILDKRSRDEDGDEADKSSQDK